MPVRNQRRSRENGLSSNPAGNVTTSSDDQRPTLKILCAFRVLLLKIKPECCFLKINENDLSTRVDLFWDSKPLGRGCGRKASCFISVSYQLCVRGQAAEPLCPLVFSSIEWEQTHLRLYALSNHDNRWNRAYVVSDVIWLPSLNCFVWHRPQFWHHCY